MINTKLLTPVVFLNVNFRIIHFLKLHLNNLVENRSSFNNMNRRDQIGALSNSFNLFSSTITDPFGPASVMLLNFAP